MEPVGEVGAEVAAGGVLGFGGEGGLQGRDPGQHAGVFGAVAVQGEEAVFGHQRLSRAKSSRAKWARGRCAMSRGGRQGFRDGLQLKRVCVVIIHDQFPRYDAVKTIKAASTFGVG